MTYVMKPLVLIALWICSGTSLRPVLNRHRGQVKIHVSFDLNLIPLNLEDGTLPLDTASESILSRLPEHPTSQQNVENEPDLDGPDNQVGKAIAFLGKAALTGICTGLGVVLFKSSIGATSSLFYETLADALPKPAFYWPLAIYPILGSLAVASVSLFTGTSIRNGVDSIASSIDSINQPFNPLTWISRLVAAVATLGSGCSLGPEGPAVEIGTGFSRIISGYDCSVREKHRLFLCGTAAAVAAGFNAPIAGVFFAIECGNRYLAKNTIKLDESVPDGPRIDIAAIVLAASIADVVVGLGLHEQQALAITGNAYAMNSPLFELSLYVGMGLISGFISVIFTKMREIFSDLFSEKSFLGNIPFALRPILGGVFCGVVAVFYPQTLFVGYTTLDQLLAGKIAAISIPLILQLLSLKMLLTSFSLGSGLIGGVFAPCLFFGATAGTAYHDVMAGLVNDFLSFAQSSGSLDASVLDSLKGFLSIANAPAYATVGAAATLGALFRAPLTSSMLMFELTQNHDIVLPVLVSTGLGGLFAELISQPRRQW